MLYSQGAINVLKMSIAIYLEQKVFCRSLQQGASVNEDSRSGLADDWPACTHKILDTQTDSRYIYTHIYIHRESSVQGRAL